MLSREIPTAQWAAITLLAAFLFTVLLNRACEKNRPPESPSPPPVIVEVQGDVPRPGIHVLPGPASTVSDALAAAGWTRTAHPDQPVPAEVTDKPIETGQRIRFALRLDASSPEVVIENMDAATRFALGFKLDLNLASEEELHLIPNMKPEWAKIIVERRKQTQWKHIEDLNEIPGIGPKTIVKWRPHLEPLPPSQ